MGDVNYYLKKKNDKGLSLIYMQYRYNGIHKLVYSFGQTIDPKNWNVDKQRVKSNSETTSDGQYSLNDLLNNLETCCLQAYRSELKNGIPLPETLKRHLDRYMEQHSLKKEADANKPTLYGLITRFISNEITYKGKKKSPNTIKTYITTLGHLKEFERLHKYPINFETITLDFYYSFVSYLSNRTITFQNGEIAHLQQNTIAKAIQILKVFMSEAVDLGYTTNMQFKHKKFISAREETESVYLTESEIMKLYKYDLRSNNKLEQVRDLFVFGCFVGLRYSDYSEIKQEHIITIDGEYFIKLRTQKTKELVIIPTNPVVLEIFKKYSSNSNKLPKAYSNQKFNEYIKEACKAAGLVDSGRNTDKPSLELYKCISSHTARRSFATNYYLDGFPTLDLMKITGHRTEKSFLLYIKVSKLDTAKRLSAHNKKKNWGMYLLKIAV